MILATDLDGTFLHGEKSARDKLYKLVMEEKNITLVFVTGRGLESVSPLFRGQAIPVPDFIIADVGSTIVMGKDMRPVEPVQSDIRSRWPGSLEILDALKGVDDLQYQPVPQRGRCSFWIRNPQVIDEVRERIKPLDCDIIYSAGKFLDILPKGVNKGSTLQQLARLRQWKSEEILVAGDTLNDLSLFETGYKSVIPANAEPGLLEKLGSFKQQIQTFTVALSFSNSPSNSVYFASAEGAAGVMEGLRHFELHPDQAKQKSNRFLIG
jgi:hydroxymethylpyrimidine pyrophosphatase-like HAD family hydrolase